VIQTTGAARWAGASLAIIGCIVARRYSFHRRAAT
jgi:hypothetical protein